MEETDQKPVKVLCAVYYRNPLTGDILGIGCSDSFGRSSFLMFILKSLCFFSLFIVIYLSPLPQTLTEPMRNSLAGVKLTQQIILTSKWWTSHTHGRVAWPSVPSFITFDLIFCEYPLWGNWAGDEDWQLAS